MTPASPETHLIESDLADAALERLLVTAGVSEIHRPPGSDWTVSGNAAPQAIDAANAIRHAIHGIYSAQDDVTEALITSQDHLIALRALTQVNLSTLGMSEALHDLLDQARVLTASDLVVMVDDRLVHTTGGPPSDSDELTEVIREATTSTDDLEPRLVGQGKAVIAPLNDQSGGIRALAFVRTNGPVYTTGDLRLVKAAVAAADMRFTLTRLHLLEIKRATFEREHQVASSLAQAVFSQPAPTLAGVEVFAHTEPASLAGGDFFAFAVVGDVLWFTVGDVAGKGLPAAMVMTRAVSAARVAFLTHDADDPAGAMRAMGIELYDYLEDVGLFITVALGAYRPSTGALHVCNAGHSPVMLVLGGITQLIPASMPPLGVLPEPRGRTVRFDLRPNDALVLGSDGLAEQENAHGVMLGYDRLTELCVELPQESAERLGHHILDAVKKHADGTPPSDDRTLVILRAVEGVS
jgi:serine phosphatase RsbU (regulator of sigma subunit)